MAIKQDMSWTRGQIEEWTLLITNADGTPSDTTTATAIELEIKPYAGAPDPATLHLGLGTGITRRLQIGTDVGVHDLVATNAQTYGLHAGSWEYDVFVTRSDTGRKRTQYGTLHVDEVVNFL